MRTPESSQLIKDFANFVLGIAAFDLCSTPAIGSETSTYDEGRYCIFRPRARPDGLRWITFCCTSSGSSLSLGVQAGWELALGYGIDPATVIQHAAVICFGDLIYMGGGTMYQFLDANLCKASSVQRTTISCSPVFLQAKEL